MTRAEKIEKRKARAKRRYEKRRKAFLEIRKTMQSKDCSLSQAKHYLKYGYIGPWLDSNSPTGMSQYCDWQGTCQFPCNGDC
jgi:hypothetical protein